MPLRRTVLHSLEPEDNRFRFFVIEQRPEPEGRVALVRRWGRLGAQTRMAVATVDTPDAIAQAHETLLARRLLRGYRIVEDGAPSAPSSETPAALVAPCTSASRAASTDRPCSGAPRANTRALHGPRASPRTASPCATRARRGRRSSRARS
ncbi:MAG: WGR domain-containing protein [Sandaracinaceae bacterium]|nr:WGR domain-containing protein [Sandaracinaceae bacterium]